MGALKHYNIKISGKVQGVFFRDSTKKKAQELGLSGFVRNEPDGSVYIEAEGDAALLEEFVAWCKHGPQLARVENIDIQEGDYVGFDAFVIAF